MKGPCLVILLAAAGLCTGLAASEHRLGGLPQRHLPFAGNGTCHAPKYDQATDTTTVMCLGPKHILSPGQTIDTMMLLENPFPEGEVVVINQTGQMVDDNLRPVPLSEVYVHHYGSALVQGSGAELRGSFSRTPFAAPYARVINGTAMKALGPRLTNIQLINTIGLPEHEAKPCLECWCDHDPWHPESLAGADPSHPRPDKGDPTANRTHPASLAGSLLCCHQCPSISPFAGPVGYHLQYITTYRHIKHEEEIKPVGGIIFDVMAGSFEYQLTEAMGPDSTHVQSFDTIYDGQCPQDKPVDILRCTAHQHFGGQCVELFNLDKNETICRSCPEFGTEPGVPGQEAGYVVRIPDDELNPPYRIAPGTHVRLTSKYDASVPRFGIMGLLFTWVAGMTHPCPPFPTNSSANTLSVPPYAAYFNTPHEMMGIPLTGGAAVLTS